MANVVIYCDAKKFLRKKQFKYPLNVAAGQTDAETKKP